MLSDALSGLQGSQDDNLLVGFDTADDAAVYRLSDEIAMINTIDFITPPVDDPYWFGQIAAANSISDIYSMGGKPLTALNVVMFPARHLDMGVLKEILQGGNDKVVEAGASLVGGHSVEDDEPKYGLSVSGIVSPNRVITNSGAEPGDVLILTKPLGSGVLFNAVRSGKLSFAEIEREVLPSLAALNKSAMDEALAYELHAATDVTGFGILGHAMEMSFGCGFEICINFDQLPFYPHAHEMYKKGETTGSNEANKTMVESKRFEIRRSLTPVELGLLYDPQTSGGLLLSLPASQADQLIQTLHKNGVHVAVKVGEVRKNPAGIIVE